MFKGLKLFCQQDVMNKILIITGSIWGEKIQQKINKHIEFCYIVIFIFKLSTISLLIENINFILRNIVYILNSDEDSFLKDEGKALNDYPEALKDDGEELKGDG